MFSERSLQIVGRGDPELKEDVRFSLESSRYCTEPLPNEIEKSERDILFIERMNWFLKVEMMLLDLEEEAVRFKIYPERIHVLSGEEYEKNARRLRRANDSGGSAEGGAYRSLSGNIYVNRDEAPSVLEYYETILHESLHAASKHKYIMADDPEAAAFPVRPYRVGYAALNRSSKEEGSHFIAFNEGMTEELAWDILEARSEEMEDYFGIPSEEVRNANRSGSSYCQPRLLVLRLLSGISLGLGKSMSEVWRDFRRGYFTGEMMHLRAVEREYGRGSLRIMDRMVADPKDKEEYLMNEKILRYFDFDTAPEERQRLAKEILSEA
jgi:hypothetical protein